MSAAPTATPELTRQKALAMQHALIAQYARPDFQSTLRTVIQEAGPDPKQKTKARQQACLVVQGPILAKYGFEPSAKGVLQCLSVFASAPWADDARIEANNRTMKALVHLELQTDADADARTEGEANCKDGTGAAGDEHPAFRAASC